MLIKKGAMQKAQPPFLNLTSNQIRKKVVNQQGLRFLCFLLVQC